MTNDLCRGAALLALCTLAWGACAQALPAPLDETTGALQPPAVSAPPAWPTLDAAARADVRARYAAWRALGDAERARIRQAQARLAALPPDQQQALRTRFDAMDAMHRDGWRLGAQIGRHYAGLQPMFGYVPPAQRAQVLDLLRALDDDQLGQLAVISQRTAPPDRARLRDDLLAQAPGARAAWLRSHLAR
ncbi:DUF3106 domain-containing protein [Stenotrophomonas sp. HITSZ_GD]|uniref:DUF3106 domain-containing protein n=1 Tax=Stenotrophomonas sp. HITSZ_GD TaxID=3037248 RepID=UPI00240E58D7|nr:DUF3106 domain-containing protein [Stenotrophomonas sp. HITSZ_GD]MDG2525110.1 DUF3106 domain-containing protein [Stenotrophomonas sp. HITSZ_GD]